MVKTIVVRVFLAVAMLSCAKIISTGYLISLGDDGEVGGVPGLPDKEVKATATARQLAGTRVSDKAGNDTLQADLRAARAQIAQADHDRAAAADALRSTQDAAAKRQAELLAARQHTAALEAIRPAVLSRPLASIVSGVRSESSSRDDVRVILRYRMSSDKARVQATSLKVALDGLGYGLVSVSEDARAAPGTIISFYYKQDEDLAEELASGIKSARPRRKQISTGTMTPFPGTVEVSVGG